MKYIGILLIAVFALSACCKREDPKLSQRDDDIRLAECHARGMCTGEEVTAGEKTYVAEMREKWEALPEEEKKKYESATPSGYSAGDLLMAGFIGYMLANSGSSTSTTVYTSPPASTAPQPSKPSSTSRSPSSSFSYGGSNASGDSSSSSGSRSSGSGYSGSRSSGSSYGSSGGSRSSGSGGSSSSSGGSRSSGSSYGSRR